MERFPKNPEKKKAVVPGIYSEQLQKADSAYEVGLYDEAGASVSDRPFFSKDSAVVVGREFDTEENMRRQYFVDKAGHVFEVWEFRAYPFEDDKKKILRTIYKDGAGNILAVEAYIMDKGEPHTTGNFWEWTAEKNSGPWDRTKLERDGKLH